MSLREHDIHTLVTSSAAGNAVDRFPADAPPVLGLELNAYAGQQVTNGDQAHAYADNFIGLHLQKIGQGHPYSYWSGQAIAATDPATKAAIRPSPTRSSRARRCARC